MVKTNYLSRLGEEQTLGGTPFHKTNPAEKQYLLHVSLLKNDWTTSTTDIHCLPKASNSSLLFMPEQVSQSALLTFWVRSCSATLFCEGLSCALEDA